MEAIASDAILYQPFATLYAAIKLVSKFGMYRVLSKMIPVQWK
jgi:hypothetical protein